MKKYLEAGKVRNTHGVKGALKIEHWCDEPGVFAALPRVYTEYSDIYKEHKIIAASITGEDTLIIRLEDVNTFEDAAKLKNSVLYASRDDLPDDPDRVFIADMIGLPVYDADTGSKYGTLADVSTNGAQELYVVKTPIGERSVPAVKEFIKEVDPQRGIFIRPIPGLLD
ncbi:MAG: 16S rRNA processing protein RimM [Clostridia bacterium]|nr:16S rRNA processing protein RimM [Clostridia bacterium]